MRKGGFLRRPGPVREVCTCAHTQVLAHTAAHVLLLLPVYFLTHSLPPPIYNVKDSLLYASLSCSLLKFPSVPRVPGSFHKTSLLGRWGEGNKTSQTDPYPTPRRG